MPETRDQGARDFLQSLGGLLLRWNDCEYMARQMLRAYVADDAITDRGHVRLSKLMGYDIEVQLQEMALPAWRGSVGAPLLEALISALGAARLHRNHWVHGVHVLSSGGQAGRASAVVMPAPVRGQAFHPEMVTLADLLPIVRHVDELATFAHAVSTGFDQHGARIVNADGSMAELPAPIIPLPEVVRTAADA